MAVDWSCTLEDLAFFGRMRFLILSGWKHWHRRNHNNRLCSKRSSKTLLQRRPRRSADEVMPSKSHSSRYSVLIVLDYCSGSEHKSLEDWQKTLMVDGDTQSCVVEASAFSRSSSHFKMRSMAFAGWIELFFVLFIDSTPVRYIRDATKKTRTLI
jgi:hypothetical protein